MQITITKEEQIILQELKQDLIRIKQGLVEWSIGLLILIKDSVVQFILSYNEFAISNIKRKGLVNILSDRALRFFKMDYEEVEKDKKDREKPRKRTVKYYVLKGVKVIFFPAYLIICAMLIILNKKIKKNVINKYET
ncbi:MAG: hypothetical protein COA32_09970 [Fluviicola sp.]|nr:MAG: hypothetical protein COA32_09970 [Fluviicola sp.]